MELAYQFHIKCQELIMKQALLKLSATAVLLLVLGSLFAQHVTVLGDIDIVPNPMDKQCTISVKVNQNAALGINIEDTQGNVIKSLWWGTTSKDVYITWDRYSDNGEYVASGTYFLVVNFAGRYTSTKKTLILK